MRTHVVRWLCVAMLFVAFVLWRSISDYEFPLRLAVCSGAVVVAVQAFHSARNRWAICFLSSALLFNPAIAFFPLDDGLGLGTIVLAAAAFAVSLTRLKSLPLLSIPSITDRNPGSESL